jgi:hypothetical protein
MTTLLDNDQLRRFFSGRRRFQLGWLFAILLIFNASQYPSMTGAVICFIGAALRFWSAGFLRKEAKLAVGGPYQYTRNPLYLGWFLMGIGACFSVGATLLTIGMGIVFFLTYHYVIEHEERKLPGYFGEAYLKYCEMVPRFIPQLDAPDLEDLKRINPHDEVYEFSFDLAWKNKAFEALLSFLGLMIGMILLVWIKVRLGFLVLPEIY